jgi:hypothetical protein
MVEVFFGVFPDFGSLPWWDIKDKSPRENSGCAVLV